MLAETFSHGLIRDFVVAFGTMFNNIKINRRAASGETEDTIAIPLSYAPQQRYLERITQDLNLDRPVALSLPRMSFEVTSMNYSSERKLNTMQRYYGKRTDSANTQLASTYSPVPYDFNFQLSVYITNIEDGTHIIEQILPYFTPEFTVSLKSVTELGINMDLPIVLNSVNMEDSYEGGFDERRVIIWTLDFTLKGQLFGPVTNSGIINKIMVNLHPSMNTSSVDYEQIYTVPGQFANGSPTTKRELSILPTLIAANSDYGISQDILNVGDDVNTHKRWDFNESVYTEVATFGKAVGSTTYDGWGTYESDGSWAANGYVELSMGDSYLRHSIIKTASDAAGDHYRTNVYLDYHGNTTPFFEPFYGKNYQDVTVRIRTNQLVGSGAQGDWAGFLYWTTTNAGEENFQTGADENSNDRLKVAYETSPFGSDPFSYNSLSDDYRTIHFFLKERDAWNNRIINGFRFEFMRVDDELGEMNIATDIDYIKISANTTG